MLDKKFDTAVIGKSFLSFLFSLDLVQGEEKVLLLDDQRICLGGLYNSGVSPLEVYFLKCWGRRRGIKALEEIERFLIPEEVTFSFDSKQMLLGGDPALNFRELLRKFPYFFKGHVDEFCQLIETKEQRDFFNEQVDQFMARLGENAFRHKNASHFRLEFFLTHAPPIIRRIFAVFQDFFKSEQTDKRPELWSARLFMILHRVRCHKVISLKETDYELFHAFLSLLGPHYRLKQGELEEELINVFKEKGGQYKRTQVREWKFYENRPWSLELASFEGVIHPKKVSFIGGVPSGGMPLRIETGSKYYNTLKVVLRLDHKKHSLIPKGPYLRVSGDKVGTSMPLWWLQEVIDKEGFSELHIELLISLGKASKVSFYQEEAISFLEDELATHLFIRGLEKSDWSVEMGNAMYLSESLSNRKKTVPLLKKVNISDFSSPGRQKRLKNVYYYGPYREAPLGLLSGLMEMKEGHLFLT